jgi:hypothetical protein
MFGQIERFKGAQHPIFVHGFDLSRHDFIVFGQAPLRPNGMYARTSDLLKNSVSLTFDSIHATH